MNSLITCKKCNNKKGDTTPFYDIYGKELKAKALPTHYCQVGEFHRPEWEDFLIFKKP